jgi:hypothetical protein
MQALIQEAEKKHNNTNGGKNTVNGKHLATPLAKS